MPFSLPKPLLLIATVLLPLAIALSATQVAETCHCDLTQSFCDFDCCCDQDCSTTISEACFNSKSAQFCLDLTFYFKINPIDSLASTGTQGCYYYNLTTELQEEVYLNSWQIKSFASSIANVDPLPSDTEDMYNGYESNSLFEVGGSSSFDFLNADGSCVGNGGSGSFPTKLRFGADIEISCTSPNSDIKLYSSILGKTVTKYFNDSNALLTIPTPAGTYSEVTLYFILATYGSQQALYIQSVEVSSSNKSGSGIRSLAIKFIDPAVDFSEEDGSPSFFPQIPYDIFYPIHQIAFKF